MSSRLEKVYIKLSFISVSVLICLGIFFSIGVPYGHSIHFNLNWAEAYLYSAKHGEILPRFIPTLWSGFGGYDFFFYAPLPFWIIGHVVAPVCQSCSTETQILLGTFPFLIGSGFTFFCFLSSILKHGWHGFLAWFSCFYHTISLPTG